MLPMLAGSSMCTVDICMLNTFMLYFQSNLVALGEPDLVTAINNYFVLNSVFLPFQPQAISGCCQL